MRSNVCEKYNFKALWSGHSKILTLYEKNFFNIDTLIRFFSFCAALVYKYPRIWQIFQVFYIFVGISYENAIYYISNVARFGIAYFYFNASFFAAACISV